ncbi:hypothetical protein N7523_005696 [Penicillium sp. IBT 18751x]|nr:hypothetical protein N7523_005696 [Penicillium sp. IBT 18751x]
MTSVFPIEIWIKISESLRFINFTHLARTSSELLGHLTLTRDLFYTQKVGGSLTGDDTSTVKDISTPAWRFVIFDFTACRPLVITQSLGDCDYECTTNGTSVILSSMHTERCIDVTRLSSSVCSEMDNKNPTELVILESGHSTVVFGYKGQKYETIVAMKPTMSDSDQDPDDVDITWVRQGTPGYYSKHLVRYHLNWLVYIYANNGVLYFELFNLWRQNKCFKFDRNMELGNMGFDACCEIHVNDLWHIQRRVEHVPRSEIFAVSYHVKIFTVDKDVDEDVDEDDKSERFKTEILQAYDVAGDVTIGQLSFEGGTLVDMIGVRIRCHSEGDKGMQWSCFTQELQNLSLNSSICVGPAHIVQTGPMCCETCLQQCKSSMQTSVARGHTKVMNSRIRRYPLEHGDNRISLRIKN